MNAALPKAAGQPLDAVHAWIGAFNSNDVDQVLALYAPAAVLWGTLATDLIDTHAGLRVYFERALQGDPGPSVELQSVLVQDLGGLAVASGAYRLQLSATDLQQTLRARFTFVLERTPASWRILNHHSSAMPAGPRQGASGD